MSNITLKQGVVVGTFIGLYALMRNKTVKDYEGKEKEEKKDTVEVVAGGGMHGPGYASPMDAMNNGPREKLLYVPCIYTGTPVQRPDYLATVDADENSPTYGKVIHRLEMTAIGDEIHHSGWDSCSSCYKDPKKKRRNLILPSLRSGTIYVIDTYTDPKAPRFRKIVDGREIKKTVGVSYPHTSHCLANGKVMISTMGDEDERGCGRFLLLDSEKDFEIAGTWEHKKVKFGYDFWYQPRFNVMISTEWGNPSFFKDGFDPQHVANGQYGSKLHVWDWTTHEKLQDLELGANGLIPLEIRFLHNPDKADGFVAAALSSTVFHIFLNKETGKWETEEIISVPPIRLQNWALPECPALITDILISLDDRYLYFSDWLHGDIRQYDITDPSNPKLVGQVWLGGVYRDGSPFKLSDESAEAPKVPLVQDTYITGGPQMIQLSLDGKRLYCTTSLFSSWDKQFYPKMHEEGAKMVMIDVDNENGGLTINPDFITDFGKEPHGPALAHEVRYPGGDCTSDIWI